MEAWRLDYIQALTDVTPEAVARRLDHLLLRRTFRRPAQAALPLHLTERTKSYVSS